MLTVVCWKWKHPTYRTKYTAEHVNVLQAMLRRHYADDHRLICVTDDPEGIKCETFPLWNDCSKLVNPNGANFPSCFRRLKIFDAGTLREMGVKPNARVVSIDLDVVLVDDVSPMFDRDDIFVGWQGVGSQRPRVYNGTLFMHRAGTMQHLWNEFDPMTSPAEAKKAGYFGSDQGYLSHKLNGSVPGWDVPDILSYNRDVDGPLPKGARIVSFNGKLKPWDIVAQEDSSWIVKHWRL